MTTEIARMDRNAVAVLGGANDALDRLARWVDAARNAHMLVAPLVNTAFVPEAYKPKVDPRATPEQRRAAEEVAIANATAAVLQGITLGLDPLTALQQIYIVHGRPGMYAKLMVALVQAHGHEVWDEDLSDSRAVVCGRRNGSEHTVRIVVTMDQARKAGWTSNQAYTKTPQDMLWARAASRVCDRIASDVLKGIASVEEIRDELRVDAEVGTRTVSPRRRPPISSKAIEAAIDATEEPPLEDDRPPAETLDHPSGTGAPVDEQPRLITQAQQRKLHALFRENDLGDRDAGLLYIGAVIGRPVETTKELTVAEAGTVIDSLDNREPESTLDPEP